MTSNKAQRATTRTISSARFIAVVLISIIASGCGQSTTKLADESTSDQATTSVSRASSGINPAADPALQNEMKQALVGVWLGMPQLNQERLKTKLSSLDADAKARLMTFVQNFQTTVMAVEYGANGRVYSEIQVNVDNKPVFEASEGSWTITSATQDRLSVNTVEELPDGKLSQSLREFTFYENRNVMATVIPTHPELSDLEPQLVFTREDLDQADAIQAQGNQAPGQAVR